MNPAGKSAGGGKGGKSKSKGGADENVKRAYALSTAKEHVLMLRACLQTDEGMDKVRGRWLQRALQRASQHALPAKTGPASGRAAVPAARQRRDRAALRRPAVPTACLSLVADTPGRT